MTPHQDSCPRSGTRLRRLAGLLVVALAISALVAWRARPVAEPGPDARGDAAVHQQRQEPPATTPATTPATIPAPVAPPERTSGAVATGDNRATPSSGTATAVDLMAVSGLVVDEHGTGVPGAVVSAARNREGYTTNFFDTVERGTITDGNGHWTIESLPAGRWIVRATHPGWAPGYTPPSELDPATASRPIVIELRHGYGLRGTVRRAGDDTPVDGAVVSFGWGGDVTDGVEVHTDRTGQFRFEHLPLCSSDSGLLSVQAEGFLEWSYDVRTGGAPIEVRLDSRRPIVIRLRDERGGPPNVRGTYLVREYIAGVLRSTVDVHGLLDNPGDPDLDGWVTLRIEEDLPPLPRIVPPIEQEPDVNKKQRFPVAAELVRDRICVLLRDGRHVASEPIEAPAGEGPIVIELRVPDSPRITGRVLAPDGSPCIARVAYRPAESLDLKDDWSALLLDDESRWPGTLTDRDGCFELSMSGVGPYELHVRAYGRAPYRDPRLIQPTMSTAPIEIRLP